MSTFKIEKQAKKPLGDTVVAPYWLVRRVQDKNMANMRKTTIQCTMKIEAEEEAVQRVAVPVLQNTRAVKAGEELLLHVEPQPH